MVFHKENHQSYKSKAGLRWGRETGENTTYQQISSDHYLVWINSGGIGGSA